MLPIVLALSLPLPVTISPQDEKSKEEEPEEERGVLVHEPTATPGYTLFSPLASTSVYLVNNDGEVVHSWETEYTPGSMVYLRGNGNLIRGGHVGSDRFKGGGMGGLLQEFNWDGELVWEHRLADEGIHQHHDVEILPDGNLLVLAWEWIPREQVLQCGRDPRAVGDEGLWSDVVYELKPTPSGGAQVVWEWHAWDHLIQDYDEDLPHHGSVPDNPGRIDINADHRDSPPLSDAERERLAEVEAQMKALGYAGDDEEEEEDGPTDSELERMRNPDWLHTNAVAYDPVHDLIALSSPEMNEIWVIDHSTTTEEASGRTGGRYGKGGDLLWRWGNPRMYGRGKASDRRLFYQHDPTWQRGSSGPALLLYNNGGGRPDGNWSSVIELVLPFHPERGFSIADGRPFGPEEPSWTYTDGEEFFGAFISGAQRLGSGNTLICCGPSGRLFEVNTAGEILWEYLSPLGGEQQPGEDHPKVPGHAIFRAHRYAPDHPAFEGRF